MSILRIYTDGGCAGNQNDINFGGWGAVLEFGEHRKELYGGGQHHQQSNGAYCCHPGFPRPEAARPNY